MKRIIPVILVFVFFAGTGISNANTSVYIQETHLGAKNFFSVASAGRTPGERRNNHTLKSHKRTVTSSVTVDQNGNTTQKGTQKFYYDYQNRVVRTADSQGTTTSEIKYDALGRRTQKVIGTDTLNYYYDGDMVIEERDGSDQVLRQYVNGNRIDEVCAIANYVNGIYANTYYVHTDGIGSTTAITNQSGNIVERVSYDVYGQPTFTDGTGTVIPGSTIGNTVLFQGRQYDTETNLYYFRARHYDPTMGRFLQTDPMGYQDSMNLYQAFNNNPVNFTDLMGLMRDPNYFGLYNLVVHDEYKRESFRKWYTENWLKSSLSGILMSDAGDIPAAITSVKDFIKKPSITGFVFMIVDVAGAVLPVAQSPGKYKRAVQNLADTVHDLDNVLDTFKKEEKLVDDVLDTSREVNKKVKNPYGKKGGPLHQGKIQEVVDKLQEKGYIIDFEEYVKTPGGYKNSRYADIIVVNPKTTEKWLIQVGKQTKKGRPISREMKAIKDLESEGWKVEFVPYI